MTRFRSSTDREERIDGTASIIRDRILSSPGEIAALWTDIVNADGLGLLGAEVADLLLGPGTKIARALRVMKWIEARVEAQAKESALEEAVAVVDGKQEE